MQLLPLRALVLPQSIGADSTGVFTFASSGPALQALLKYKQLIYIITSFAKALNTPKD